MGILRDFIKDESGILPALFGAGASMLGLGAKGVALASAAGGVAGAAFDNYQDRKQTGKQNALDMQRFVRLRKAAEMGGFHPLEALRSGNVIDAQAMPRLRTSMVDANAFDRLEAELTGEAAKERRRQEVDDEIQERQLENLQYDVAQKQQTQSTIQTNRPPRLSTPPFFPSSDDRGGQVPEGIPGAVTTTDTEGDPERRRYNDPNRGDMGNLTERHGESEIVESVAFPVLLGLDAAYDRKVRDIARVTGRTAEDVHGEIAAGGKQAMRRLYALVLKGDEDKNPAGRSPGDPAFWGLPEKPHGSYSLPGTTTRKPRVPYYPDVYGF